MGKTPKMVPKTPKQGADVDAVVDAARRPVTTTATTIPTRTASTTNTTAATLTATTTAVTRRCTTTTTTITATTTKPITVTNIAANHAATLVTLVDVDAAPAVATEREREEPSLKRNSRTRLDSVLTGLVMVWRVNVMAFGR